MIFTKQLYPFFINIRKNTNYGYFILERMKERERNRERGEERGERELFLEINSEQKYMKPFFYF